MSQSIGLDLFDAYLKNGVDTGKIATDSTAILCPLCLAPIQRASVADNVVAIEHIIPQHSTAQKLQATPQTQIAVKNVRSGLTLTCPGCNAHKGSNLDFHMRNRILPGKHSRAEYPYETGTAILTYGYLLAFAVYGYEYILRSCMAEIRDQFKAPHVHITNWLDHALVHLDGPEQPIVCNELGYPFIAGMRKGEPLNMVFWRFKVKLPSIDGVKSAVDIPASIVALAHQG